VLTNRCQRRSGEGAGTSNPCASQCMFSATWTTSSGRPSVLWERVQSEHAAARRPVRTRRTGAVPGDIEHVVAMGRNLDRRNLDMHFERGGTWTCTLRECLPSHDARASAVGNAANRPDALW
jgi:hypothetical protein